MRFCLALCFLCCSLFCSASEGAAPRLQSTPRLRERQQKQQLLLGSWQMAVRQTILSLHAYGQGGYSTSDAAKAALQQSFTWNEHLQRPVFDASVARPSFCSGAVYSVVLSAILQWELKTKRRALSREAWLALLPQMQPDGVGAWGWANANGPGFAMLVHELGAGYSFTDLSKAQAADVLKIWWTDEIGGRERGHLVVFDKDEGDSIRVWSSHQARNGKAGGYGLRSYPKSSIRRVLLTRITNPAAFARAPRVGNNAWLGSLLSQSTTWEECLRRAAASPASGSRSASR